jgi:hypothetical protein
MKTHTVDVADGLVRLLVFRDRNTGEELLNGKMVYVNGKLSLLLDHTPGTAKFRHISLRVANAFGVEINRVALAQKAKPETAGEFATFEVSSERYGKQAPAPSGLASSGQDAANALVNARWKRAKDFRPCDLNPVPNGPGGHAIQAGDRYLLLPGDKRVCAACVNGSDDPVMAVFRGHQHVAHKEK